MLGSLDFPSWIFTAEKQFWNHMILQNNMLLDLPTWTKIRFRVVYDTLSHWLFEHRTSRHTCIFFGLSQSSGYKSAWTQFNERNTYIYTSRCALVNQFKHMQCDVYTHFPRLKNIVILVVRSKLCYFFIIQFLGVSMVSPKFSCRSLRLNSARWTKNSWYGSTKRP